VIPTLGVAIHTEIIAGSAFDGHQQVALMAVGPEFEVATAAKYLQTLTPLFSKSDPPGALTAPLTWPLVVQLSATFGPAFVPGQQLCRWIEEQVRLRQPVAAGTPPAWAYTLPDGLTPYPWQVEGAQVIGDLGSALITDEPGTGKTITTILGLINRYDRAGGVFPILVVCPASVVDPWVTAWQTWFPMASAVAWRGSPAKRIDLLGTADVYVTSYETCRQDAPAVNARKLAPLVELGAGALVIDECHLIKNNQTARSQAVRRLAKKVTAKGGPVVGLSGTPITHHPGDLWPTLDALQHDAWPAKERWVKRYCVTLPGAAESGQDQILGLHPASESEFRLTLLGQHRRVAKADVLTQLPPKVYSVRTVELPKAWRKVYDDFEAQMLAELPDGSELSVMDTLSVLGHLRQLSAAAADVDVTYGPDVDERTGQPKRHVHLELKSPSWKVDALLELLEERPQEPVVAFAPSRQLMMLAGAAAAAGRRVGYVVGEQSAAERTRAVQAFQAGELDLICATTGAGGVGITLTAARTCVFLQRPWSLVESIQAEDRCHRIGSEIHDSVEIVDIVAKDTLDSRVRAVLKQRAGQLSELVQDPRIVTELLGGSSIDLRKAS
jgi:SNF2 family DNA or RNA helicase